MRKAILRAKWAYFALRNCRSFLQKELELNGLPRSWRSVRLLWHGFHSDKRHLYLANGRGLPLASYVGDFERLMKRRANGQYSDFLDSKILFSQVFSSHVRCPINFGFIAQGVFIPLDPRFEAVSRHAPLADDLLPSKFVLKRVSGGGGKNIFLVERRDGTFRVNGEAMALPALEALIAEARYLITELLTQSAYGQALYPHSINTVRVVTMRDRDGPFVAFAVQRIGRECSRPTDNLNRGGLAAPIDLETGTLGPARNYEATRQAEPYDRHPETGGAIEGQTVPGWTEIRASLIEIMVNFPGLRYVGWDVVTLDDGFLVLEGNSYPGVQVAQLHFPLKNDPRIAAFFEQLSRG